MSNDLRRREERRMPGYARRQRESEAEAMQRILREQRKRMGRRISGERRGS